MQKKSIKMIVPVPLPEEALSAFAARIPVEIIRPDITVDFVGTRAGATILDSPYELALADAFCLEAGAAAEAEGYSAVCINSMSDSGLAALRSRLSIPVIGPGASSYLLACNIGKKFSVVTMWERWTPLTEKVLGEQGLMHRLASVRHIETRPDSQELLAGKEEAVFPALLAAAQKCLSEDGADVIVLGSTTMHQSYRFLQDHLDAPVINPGLVAFKLCEMLLDLGLTHSRYAYPAPETLNDDVFRTT